MKVRRRKIEIVPRLYFCTVKTVPNYYEVLGINRDDSLDEIKRAYRSLALQYHPDRVPPEKKKEAREKFKEISEAYAVLSDPKKRAQYDRFGHAGIDATYTHEDIFRGADFSGFEDILRSFGFGESIFGDLFDFFGAGRGGRKRATKGADLEYTQSITLEEAASGTEKEIGIFHTVTCSKCGGAGAKPGTERKTCPQCQGTGQVSYGRRGFFTFSFSQTCSRCGGSGEVIETLCPLCNGRGKVKKSSSISLKIPPGVDTGTGIRVRGKGEAGELGGPSGDLYVVIHVKPHKILKREGGDLYIEVPIHFTTACLGGEIEVPTLRSSVKMRVPPGTPTDKVFKLKRKGMPSLHGSGQGDEYVRVIVQVPTKLTSEQKKLLEELRGLEHERSKGIFKKMFRQ